MPKTYTELYYHFVWATRGREFLIAGETEPRLFRQIRSKCEEMSIRVHALNGMPDHVHLVCTLPTTLSIADTIERIKGSSSHFINQVIADETRIRWQEGYGALTLAKRDLKMIVAYVDNQKSHHTDNSLHDKLERVIGE
jgi:putative transposase